MTDMILRAMQASDSPGLQSLMENDPETGGMSSTTRFLVPPFEAWSALKADMLGVVAENAAGEVVGCATGSFEQVQFEGRVLPSIFLENVKIHHSLRGQGIGKRLMGWLIEQGRARFGDVHIAHDL